MRKILVLLSLLLAMALCIWICIVKDNETIEPPQSTSPTTPATDPGASRNPTTGQESDGPDLGPGGLPIL